MFTFSDFIKTAAGQRLYAWEMEHFDKLVINAFGAQAVQVGAPVLPALRENRMHNRLQLMSLQEYEAKPAPLAEVQTIFAEPEALPLPEESCDLVILPHTLDYAESPHQALREAVRILEPEGRLILTAFNPFSPWWARQRMIQLGASAYLPDHTCPIALYRLKDWLALLGLEIDVGHFGVYAPPVGSKSQIGKWNWLDKAGDRWWPHGANLVLLSAVKRLPGAKLIGKISFSLGDSLLSGTPSIGVPKSLPRGDTSSTLEQTSDEKKNE